MKLKSIYCYGVINIFPVTNAQTASTAKSMPLIPRKILFSNPEKTAATISPDGTKIGYLAPCSLSSATHTAASTLGSAIFFSQPPIVAVSTSSITQPASETPQNGRNSYRIIQ